MSRMKHLGRSLVQWFSDRFAGKIPTDEKTGHVEYESGVPAPGSSEALQIDHSDGECPIRRTGELLDINGLLDILRGIEHSLTSNLEHQQLIHSMHEELQGFRRGLLSDSLNPILMGIIGVSDHIGDRLKLFAVQESADLSYELKDIQQEIKDVLTIHGVSEYLDESGLFNPARQIAVETIPAPSPGHVGLIVSRRRTGFEFQRNSVVLRPEQVSVYRESDPDHSGG